jgi:hypothetical protein
MLKQKTQNILIAVLIIAVVILASALVIGLNRMIAQAQDEGPNINPSGSVEPDEDNEGYAAIGDKPPGTIPKPGIGGQSTMYGVEYVPSSAFRHDGSTGSPSGYRFWWPAGYIRNNDSYYMCIAAPVYLPHGATITEFGMYFVDDHSTYDTWRAYLWRSKQSHPPGTTAETVADLDFLDSYNIDDSTIYLGWSRIITSGTETVSNEYGYTITFCFDPNTGMYHRIYGFHVMYE